MQNKKIFGDIKVNTYLYRAISKLNWNKPTEIQQKAIPKIKSGKDIIVIAQTGTGKTATYTIPIINKLNFAQNHNPRALILTPTRELAIQVQDHFNVLAVFTTLRIISLYGGISFKMQSERTKNGADIIISTPQRLLDTYFRSEIILSDINTLVIDEADKMMNMGFVTQLRKVIDIIPKKRQNLLFSATFPEKVEKLTSEFLDFPFRINITTKKNIPTQLKQFYYKVPNFITKIKLLEHLLKKKAFKKVIIFAQTKTIANNIYKFINRKFEGNARVMHSNKSQNSRINSINDFSQNKIRFLVTTGVAARGIDIQNVTHVINFQLPYSSNEYIHHIGRTGRNNNVGTAISFTNPAEELMLQEIEKKVKTQIVLKKIPENVEITETPKQEMKSIEWNIDKYKRKKDPTFRCAFHSKKRKYK